MHRALPLALALLLAACGAAPRRAPHAPALDPAALLPPDAPLTGVVRPRALAALPLPDHPALGWLTPDRLTDLGLDPDAPVWFALRAGPLHAVTRAADDAERLLAAPIATLGPAAPFADATAPELGRWFTDHPLPPAWLHLRLIGAPGPAIDLEARLAATHGPLIAAALTDPPETLAAALAVAPEALADLDLDAPGLRLYRPLDALPFLVAARARPDARIIDLIWDWDLGDGALLAALRALPERRHPDPTLTPVPAAHRVAEPLDATEIARLRLDHDRFAHSARMLGDVDALAGVLGQGQLPIPPLEALRHDRRLADRPRALLAPTAAAFIATGLTLARDPAPGRLRARLTLDYAPAARRLAALRDGRAPIDHAAAADAAPLVVTLALAPAAATPLLTAHLQAPDAPLAEHLDTARDCGLPCLPALWTTPLAHARDLPALAAALTGHAPVAPALQDATGAALALAAPDPTRALLALTAPDAPRPPLAAAVAYPPPATVPRAAWAPIAPDARWHLADAATLTLGDPALQDALAAAARRDRTTDASALRLTLRDPTRRIDATLTFERDALALDAVIEWPP